MPEPTPAAGPDSATVGPRPQSVGPRPQSVGPRPQSVGPRPQSVAWPRLATLIVLFFLSGLASLVDQVVWLRYLSLTFGNTTYAAATLLGVFMAGLGFGALVFGRLADRFRNPLKLYAGIELGIALFVVLSPEIFRLIDGAYVWLYRSSWGSPGLFAGGRVVLATCCLLPPTLLMGATLPLMLRAVAQRQAEVGRLTALFYAVNTLGATTGVALAGFVTIRYIGLYASLQMAALANLVIAVGCLVLSRPQESPPTPSPTTLPREGAEPPPGRPHDGALGRGWLLAIFFAMGATSLAYEVLWTRILVFYLGSSVYAYSLMLFIFLLGVGAGSLLITRWADRLPRPLTTLAAVEAGIAVLALVEVALFSRLTDSLGQLSEWIQPNSFYQGVLVQLLAVLPILAPPTLLMGLSFPLAVRAASRRHERLGKEVGEVYGANTLGSIAGSLGAGFALIPAFGTQNSLLVVGALNGLVAALLWGFSGSETATGTSSRKRLWAVVAAPLLCLAAIPLFPPNRVILGAGIFSSSAPQDMVYFAEDAASSVTIVDRPWRNTRFLSLELNGVNVAGTSPELYAVQKMQGHLPLLLSSNPTSVVHIGFGSGGTAHAVSQYPLREILVVEISPQVLYASNRFFADINHGVLDDGRVEVEINDGRNFLLASARTFDLALSDSIHPRFAGNGSLYTQDYFELLKRRLNPGGVVSMWLPMYALTPRNYAMIVRAFADVFPHTTIWYEPSEVNSFTIVTGKLAPEPWHRDNLARVFAHPETAAALAELGIQGPGDILACYLLGGEELDAWLSSVPPHVDDVPAVEYDSGTLLSRNRPWLATFAQLVQIRPRHPPQSYLEALNPDERQAAIEAYQQRQTLLEAHARFLATAFRNDPRQTD